MARPRALDDPSIFAHVLESLSSTGEKTLSFGKIAALCGLAPATLAQRYGSVDAMIRAALLFEWKRLSSAVEAAEADARVSPKGAQALLKHLPTPSPHVMALSIRDDMTTAAATEWRTKVETALASRRGGGSKGKEAAALIFAAWQGRQIWDSAGGKSFRLADMLKALP